MRRLAFLVPLALVALAATAVAKLDAAKWKEAETGYKEFFAHPGETEGKTRVVRLLVEDREPRAHRLIGEALFSVAGYVVKVAKAHADMEAQLQVLLAMKYSEMRPADQQKLMQVQAETRSLDRAKQDEAKVLDLLVAAAAEGPPEDFRKGVLSRAKTHAEWTVRSAGARLAAATPSEAASKAFLVDTLEKEKEKDARVRLSALEGLSRAKGTEWHPLVVGRLADPDWSVRLLAARISGEREVGKAIPVLIEQMGKADARVADEMAAALRRLTAQNFDAHAEVWSKWWEDNRSKYGADGRPIEPLGGTVVNPRDVEFYGIKVKTDRVVFVVDMSSSMATDAEPLPTPPPGKPPGTAGDAPKDPTPPPAPAAEGRAGKKKIEIARRELKRALDLLPKTATFNVIAFNHTIQQWNPNMHPATPDGKAKAYEWFTAMEPSGTTYIDGALQMAFKMAGTGAVDKAYQGVAVDTVFLLTDGAPTDNGYPESVNMDPEEILAHVREWNARKLVKIHCIGIDRVHGIAFLKTLAAENGGTYVDG